MTDLHSIVLQRGIKAQPIGSLIDLAAVRQLNIEPVFYQGVVKTEVSPRYTDEAVSQINLAHRRLQQYYLHTLQVLVDIN